MTKGEIAAAIVDALDRYTNGQELLWVTATNLAGLALRLDNCDTSAAGQLKTVVTQLAAHAVSEESGKPRSDLVEPTLASVRQLAGHIGA